LHRSNLRVGDGLAVFIDNASGDDAAARERKINFLHRLPVENLERLARFERPPLSVRKADVAALVGVDVVAAGRQILELVRALRVGCGEASFAELR
jgi:hypothetical protein